MQHTFSRVRTHLSFGRPDKYSLVASAGHGPQCSETPQLAEHCTLPCTVVWQNIAAEYPFERACNKPATSRIRCSTSVCSRLATSWSSAALRLSAHIFT